MANAQVDQLEIKIIDSSTQVNTSLTKLSNTLKNLKDAANKNTTALGSFNNRLKDINTNAGKSTKSLTSFITKLGISTIGLQRAGQAAMKLVNLSSQYIEDLNLFAIAMGDYAQEAKTYAEEVQDVMGIDPSDWMRNQAIFMTLADGFGVASDKTALMSKNLTQLGYDISSFFNLSLEESMLKLQSGLAGELEPLRRIGYDLSIARLQQEAYKLGIDKSINSMTQAEKAMLRYYAIMTQVTTVQGDMARTLDQPANQLRILTANLNMAARAIGNIFIPALNAILPVAIAVVQVITNIANAIASLFGFEIVMPSYDTVEDIEVGTGGISDNLEDAAGNAKKLKNNLLGIDELNIISPQDNSGSGAGDALGGGGFDIELPEYDFLGDAINDRIDEIRAALERMLPILGLIGSAIAAWKLADLLNHLLGINKALSFMDRLSVWAGMLLILGGAVLYIQGAFDALENGVDWDNLIKMITGIAGIGTGLYLVFKPFLGTEMAGLIGWFSALAGSLGILAISISDMDKQGVTLQNLAGTLVGIVGSVVSLNKVAKPLNNVLSKSKNRFANLLAPMTDLLAPAAALAGSLVLFGSSFGDIIENGYTLENTLGLIAGGIGAVASAVVLVNNAFAISPLFGGITLATTLIGGLVTILGAVGNAMGDLASESEEDAERMAVWNQKMEDAKLAAEEAQTAVTNYQTSLSDMETLVTEMTAAQKLADDIYTILDATNRTSTETEIMKAKIETLNAMNIDGLQLEYDELTDSVNLSRDEVQNLIDKQLELALQQAMVQELADMYIQIEKNAREAASVQQDIQDKLMEAASYVNENGKIAPWDRENFEKAMSDANTLQTQLQTIKDSNATLGEGIENYETMLANASDGTATLADQMLSQMETVPDKMGQIGTDSAEGYNTALLENMTPEQYETMASMLPDEMISYLQIGSPSKLMYDIGSNTVLGFNNGLNETATSTLQPTITALGQNIMMWFQQALMGGGDMAQQAGGQSGDQAAGGFAGIAQQMMTSFGEAINAQTELIQGIISDFVAMVMETFKGDKKAGLNEIVFAGFAEESLQGIIDKVEEMNPDVVTTIEQLATEINDTFSETADCDTWKTFGENAVQGAIDGVKAKGPSLIAEVKSLAAQVNAAFQVSLDIHSPSGVFYDNAAYMIEGFNLGIEENEEKTERVMEHWAESVAKVGTKMASSGYSFTPSYTGVNTSYNSATVEAFGIEEAINNWYQTNVAPQMSQLVDNTQRQADKNESVSVQIGNQEVANAVKQQQRANGYSFIRG